MSLLPLPRLLRALHAREQRDTSEIRPWVAFYQIIYPYCKARERQEKDQRERNQREERRERRGEREERWANKRRLTVRRERIMSSTPLVGGGGTSRRMNARCCPSASAPSLTPSFPLFSREEAVAATRRRSSSLAASREALVPDCCSPACLERRAERRRGSRAASALASPTRCCATSSASSLACRYGGAV